MADEEEQRADVEPVASAVPELLITHPNTENSRENALRGAVLGTYRGYRWNREIFESIPHDLTWYAARLARSEAGKLRYLDYSYWNELTDDMHIVNVGVENLDFGPLILWGQDAVSPLEILEGHLRATALGLAGEDAPAVVEANIGLVKTPGSL